MTGGIAVDDIVGLVDEGGTEVGAGEDDGVGIEKEVEGGNSDETNDDIGCDDVAVVALPVDVENGLEEKSTMILVGINTGRGWSNVQSRPGTGRRPIGR